MKQPEVIGASALPILFNASVLPIMKALFIISAYVNFICPTNDRSISKAYGLASFYCTLSCTLLVFIG